MLAGLLAPMLARWGVSEAETWAKRLAPVLIALAVLALLWGAYAAIRHGGEKDGAAKVTAKVEKQHTAAVADARHDEQTAQAATVRIAERTARADVATTALVQSTIEDMHHALDAVPPAAAAAVPPPAPVDQLRDNINAVIARANRAAEAAGPSAVDDADDQVEATHR